MIVKETYDINHKTASDDALLMLPDAGPLTPSNLFVCTYGAKLGNLKIDFIKLTKIMCENPSDCLLAVNGNFGHAAQRGYERYIKTTKPPAKKNIIARGRPRKAQGDVTCFNSAVEPVIRINHPGIKAGKVYKVKCFPTTGETQIPGVVCPDLSDGQQVLDVFVEYLNKLGVPLNESPADAAASVDAAADAASAASVAAPDSAADAAYPVYIHSQQPKMMNYKFRIIRRSPRILINLRALTEYMRILESTKATIHNSEGITTDTFRNWPALVLPPFNIRETKPPTDDVKVSFKFQTETGRPRINIFQEGKINILGAKSFESADAIYQYFTNLFTANWSRLICLQPRRDCERIQQFIPQYVPPVLPHIAQDDIDAFFDKYFGDDKKNAISNIMADLDNWSDDE